MPIPTQSKTINYISFATKDASEKGVDVLNVENGSDGFQSSVQIENLRSSSKGKPSIRRVPKQLTSLHRSDNLSINVSLKQNASQESIDLVNGSVRSQEILADIRKKLVFLDEEKEEEASNICTPLNRDSFLRGSRKPYASPQIVGGETSPGCRRIYKPWNSSDDYDVSNYKPLHRKLNVDPLRENHQAHQADRISVYVRVRPMSNKEKEKGARCCVKVMNKTEIYLTETSLDPDCLRLKKLKGRYFVFDGAFPDDTCQEEVYCFSSAHLVEGVLEGRNSSVICYGATGAGKTFTMLGTLSEPGVMVLALKDLFAKLKQRSREGNHTVRLSYLEVYNEAVKDLLSPGGALVLREDARQGIVAAGITEHKACSADEVMILLQRGNQNRTTEPTRLNETSSRSHAILQVIVEYNTDNGSVVVNRTGKLSLIDLAGSERAIATDQRTLRSLEGANINRSLLALSSCINALVEGKKHIPFRNSKLTQLLKDSLGGSSQTAMIANISPSNLSFGETQNTLYWADRAKEIRTKACLTKEVVQVPESENEHVKMLLEVQKENEQLKMQVALLQQKLLAFENNAITSAPSASIEEQSIDLVGNVAIIVPEKVIQKENMVGNVEITLQERLIQGENVVGNAEVTLQERLIQKVNMVGNVEVTLKERLIQKENMVGNAEVTLQERLIQNENISGYATLPLQEKSIQKEIIVGNVEVTLQERLIQKENMAGYATLSLQEKSIQKEIIVGNAGEPLQENPIEKQNVIGIAITTLQAIPMEKENIEGTCISDSLQERILSTDFSENIESERALENTLFKEASVNTCLYIDSLFSDPKEGSCMDFLLKNQLTSSSTKRQTFKRTPWTSNSPSFDFHRIPRGYFCKNWIFRDITNTNRPYCECTRQDTRSNSADETSCMLLQVSLILFSSHANPFKRLVSCFDYILQKRFTGG